MVAEYSDRLLFFLRLTAFVMRTLKRASEYIFVDEDVMDRGINWLARHVNSDGSVAKVGYVHDVSLQVVTVYTFLLNLSQTANIRLPN